MAPDDSREPEQRTLSLLPEKRPVARNAVLDLETLPKTLPGPRPTLEMVDSVRALGVMEPIIVSVREKDGRPVYRVLDGRRRVAAAREAELDKIPARVYADEDVRGAVVTLVLNEQRTSNPVAEAEAIRELLKAGASETDVARDCKVSVATVRARLRLIEDLAPALTKALRSGKIGVTVAHRASKLHDEAQERLAGVLSKQGKLTAKDVDSEVRVRRDAAVRDLPLEQPAETGASWLVRVTPALQSALQTLPSSAPKGVREALQVVVNRVVLWGAEQQAAAKA